MVVQVRTSVAERSMSRKKALNSLVRVGFVLKGVNLPKECERDGRSELTSGDRKNSSENNYPASFGDNILCFAYVESPGSPEWIDLRHGSRVHPLLMTTASG